MSARPEWEETPLPGMRRLAVGDVWRAFGAECVCVRASESSATLRVMAAPPAERVQFGDGRQVSFGRAGDEHRVASMMDRELYVRPATAAERNKHLWPAAARPKVPNQTPAADGDGDTMKKKATNSKPRGGLAAEAMTTKRGPGRPKKDKPAEAAEKPAADAKPGRKERIRQLYTVNGGAQPLMKSQIVGVLIAEGYGAEADRAKLKAAVDNEASYMKNDGLSPKWSPEERPAKAAEATA